jgi:ACS family hexuronate transporter-like MFS transporter
MAPSDSSSPASGIRWLVCALLFFATTILYFDRQILSLLKEPLGGLLHWNDTQYGLVNSAFQLAYGLSLLAFGWIIDRFGTKIGYSITIAGWSLAAMATSLVSTLGGFFVARIALGFSEGGNFPAAIKAVALWFPKKERALATSIFNSGANVGAIAAPAIVPWLYFHFGWQAAFLVAGFAGLVWLAFWIPWYGVPAQKKEVSPQELAWIESDAGAEQETGPNIPWASLLGYRQTWAFIIPKFLTDPVWWFYLFWLPSFFKDSRGLDIKHSWTLLVTIYSIVTVISITGGWVSGYLAKKGLSMNLARKLGMLLFALCALPMLAVTHVGNWGAVLLIGLAGGAHQAWSATLFTTVSDTFPKRSVGSVIGIGGLAGSVFGACFPYITGMLTDHFKSIGQPTTGYGILFGFCAAAYLVSLLIMQILNPKLQPVINLTSVSKNQ